MRSLCDSPATSLTIVNAKKIAQAPTRTDAHTESATEASLGMEGTLPLRERVIVVRQRATATGEVGCRRRRGARKRDTDAVCVAWPAKCSGVVVRGAKHTDDM
jgi:hypothetical protein